MEEFQLESCVRGHHIYKNTWTPLLGEVLSAASRLRLTLAFAFSRSIWVRVDDSHVIFLGSVGPSCEENLYKAILSLHVQTSFRVRSMDDIQQNFGGYKIWRELNLAALAPIAKPPN